MTWWQLGEAHGALEIDQPALELHWLFIGCRSIAWWMDDEGHWLGAVTVGEC